MCLLVVLSRVVPGWPLIVAANRDERYDRPATAMTVLRDGGPGDGGLGDGGLGDGAPRTVGGRDLLAGGTWLAVNERGVVAALTNRPNQGRRDPAKRSRGEIPLALTATGDAATAVAHFSSSVMADDFNPCWVLAGDRTSLFFLDLAGAGPVHAVPLPPGVHVLENKPLGAPSTKVDHVRRLLGDVDGVPVDELTERLRAVLRDHTITLAPEAEPAGDPAAARASQVSACCVHTDGYGTRAATLVRVPGSTTATPEVWATDGPSCTHPWVAADFTGSAG